MNRYPLWKYLLVLVVVAIGGLYALPNIYEPDPAIQISIASTGVTIEDKVLHDAKAELDSLGIEYFGEEIANNLSVSIKAQEAIFHNDPSWSVYTQYVYEKADLKSKNLNNLANKLDYNRAISSDRFLSKKYSQISVGQRLSSGNVGTPGTIISYPDYWLDTSVGYNLIQKQMVFDIQTGVGLPVFGNDELYMSALWQSADKTGDKNLNLSLGYYSIF